MLRVFPALRRCLQQARRVAERAWFEIASPLPGRRAVVVLSDSHGRVFDRWSPPGWRFHMTMVWGATASGIQNPNSETRALPVFRARLRQVRRGQSVLVLLGEVDCGYTIWLRHQTGAPLEEVLASAVARYAAFLGEVEAAVASPADVLVMDPPLPTLPDDPAHWGEIASRRADAPTTQRQRTDLTLAFSAALRALCAERGWTSVSPELLDPDTGFIHPSFLRRDEVDHHLADGPYRAAIVAALPR